MRNEKDDMRLVRALLRGALRRRRALGGAGLYGWRMDLYRALQALERGPRLPTGTEWLTGDALAPKRGASKRVPHEDPQQPEERQDARQELRAGPPSRPYVRSEQEEPPAEGPPGLRFAVAAFAAPPG